MSLLGGQRAWLLQRITAVYAGVYVVLAVAWMLARPPGNHAAWVEMITQPVVWLATALFILLILLHAWVGIRDVILDYLRPASMRLLALTLAGGGLLLLGFWALWIMFEAAIR